MRHGLGSCQPSSKRSPTGPPHRAGDSRGHRRRYTRVQEISRGGKLWIGRFRSWNRGERGILLHRSEQFDSGARSTPTGHSQLWKLQKCNRRNGREVDSTSFANCTLSIGVSRARRMWGRSPDSGPVTRSVSVLVLRRRPGRRHGPGRLTPKVGAGSHPGKDAQDPMRSRTCAVLYKLR